MAVVDQASGGRRRVVGRLLDSGLFELVPAALLLALVVAYNLGVDQPWQALAVDVGSCVAAALTARFPRAGGIVLAAWLVWYLVIPVPWATLGEYSPLIAILGAGIRGRLRTQVVMTIGYGTLLVAITARGATSVAGAILSSLAWVVLLAIIWLIGYAVFTLGRAHEIQRAAELLVQRQRLARDLHDTVARSLTMVTMLGRRIQDRGSTPEDLQALIDTAQSAQDQLRLALRFLSDPAIPAAQGTAASTGPSAGSSTAEALRAGEALLQQHGFRPTIEIEGDPGRLTPHQSSVLGAAAGEAIANVVKHGDPSRPVAVVLSIGSGQAELDVLNYATQAPAPSGEKPLGLWGMQQRLAEVGGTVTASRIDDQWQTRVVLPVGTSDPRGGRLP